MVWLLNHVLTVNQLTLRLDNIPQPVTDGQISPQSVGFRRQCARDARCIHISLTKCSPYDPAATPS
jgi:hypothetical protein